MDNVKTKLDLLIEKNEELKNLKKQVDLLKTEIVNYMHDNAMDSMVSEKGFIKVTPTEKETMDEGLLIPWAKENCPDCLEQVETVNYETLNDIVYENLDLAKQLIPFRQTTIGKRVTIHANK